MLLTITYIFPMADCDHVRLTLRHTANNFNVIYLSGSEMRKYVIPLRKPR